MRVASGTTDVWRAPFALTEDTRALHSKSPLYSANQKRLKSGIHV